MALLQKRIILLLKLKNIPNNTILIKSQYTVMSICFIQVKSDFGANRNALEAFRQCAVEQLATPCRAQQRCTQSRIPD